MNMPEIVSAEEWRLARIALLAKEKDHMHAMDALNADRRRLPMVPVEKDYRLTGPAGDVGLIDLFDGHRQLIVQHFMFDPSWDTGCGSCTAMAGMMSGDVVRQLRTRSTAFAAVSRAPLATLEAYRDSKGWTFPWYSSFGSDFNFDFHVSFDPAVQPAEYNYRKVDELAPAGFEWLVDYVGEEPGVSAFLRDGDEVFHTYSTFGRGVEVMMAGYRLLDITALGRQENWEEPMGRAPESRRGDPSYST